MKKQKVIIKGMGMSGTTEITGKLPITINILGLGRTVIFERDFNKKGKTPVYRLREIQFSVG